MYIFMINTIMITKLIDTFILPEVQQELNSVQPVLSGRQPYNTNIVEWLSPVIDLSDFFVYPIICEIEIFTTTQPIIYPIKL